MNNLETQVVANAPQDSAAYEAPCIESVVMPEDIEREVAYAGNVNPSQLPPPPL